MKSLLRSKVVYLLARLVIGGLFVYAGATKVTDITGFAVTIDQYGLVTWRMAKLVAMTLPYVEIVAGLGLIFDLRGALGIVVAQLLGFIAVLAYGIHLGLDIDCGCFGSAEPGAAPASSLWDTLIRDMFMLGACLLMYIQRRIAPFEPRSLLKIFHKK